MAAITIDKLKIADFSGAGIFSGWRYVVHRLPSKVIFIDLFRLGL